MGFVVVVAVVVVCVCMCVSVCFPKLAVSLSGARSIMKADTNRQIAQIKSDLISILYNIH